MTRQSASNRKHYRFGEFLLDPAARELVKGAQLLTLAPKVFDCIAYLIENRNRAIGRDELIAAVWGRADVTDVQLRQLMRKVRRAVNDDGDRQAIVRTISHFGFYWIAEITDEDIAHPDSVPASVDVPTTPAVAAQPNDQSAGRIPSPYKFVSLRKGVAAFAMLAVLVILTLSAGDYAQRSKHDPALVAVSAGDDAPQRRDAIVVLPVDLGAEFGTDSAWMRLGLMDLIAGRLRSAALKVVPSSDIVALARDQTSETILLNRIRTATGARNLAVPLASRRNDGWIVHLELRIDDSTKHSVEAYSPDAILAAREASDHLITLLGKDLPAPLQSSSSVAELLQRIEAAMLVDDFKAARALITSAPPALRDLKELQLALARVDIATYRPEYGRDSLTKLIAEVPAEEDPVFRARALTSMGVVDFDQPALAVRHLSEAIALLENRNEPGYLGAAYNNRGIAHGKAREYEAAGADYARARIAFTLANDTLGLARVDNNEAFLDFGQGRLERGLPLITRAAQGLERFGAIEKLSAAVINQISANLDLLRPREALAVYERLRSTFDHLENPETLGFVRYVGAESLAANGRLREARALLTAVDAAANPARESDLIALANALEARLDVEDGNFDSGIAHARKAVDSLREVHKFASVRSAAWLALVRALRSSQRVAEAKLEIEKFSTWAREAGDPGVGRTARLAEAEQHWSEGHQPLATQAYEDLLRNAQNDGTPIEIAAVASSYGNALLDAGELTRTSTVVGWVGRWMDADFACAVLQARLYQALDQKEAMRAAMEKVRILAGERPIPVSLLSSTSEVATAQRR